MDITTLGIDLAKTVFQKDLIKAVKQLEDLQEKAEFKTILYTET